MSATTGAYPVARLQAQSTTRVQPMGRRRSTATSGWWHLPVQAATPAAANAPAPHSPPRDLTTTQKRALTYEPGVIRVRLTMFRDILAVLRVRYMDQVFAISLSLIVLNTAVTVWRAKYGGAEQLTSLTDWTSMPVGDVCARFMDEFGWGAPLCFFIMCAAYVLRRRGSVFLVDFALFEPPEEWRVTKQEIVDIIENTGKVERSFTESDRAFQQKVLSNSGTGDRTAWPPGIVRCRTPGLAQDQSMEATRAEAEKVICDCLKDLFARTGVSPKEVDFLVINCSLFSPTPSLCAMACNRFRMRSNCRTFNLSGQGCSASLVSVDLAADLLRSNPNSNAVVVSTELITQSLYHGHEKSMLLQNTLFRCGGAAVLLTNKPRLLLRAKYRLRHLVRTQTADDESYNAVYQCEDPDGNSGVRLSKEIVKVAGNAMKINLTQLGPLILPLYEQAKVLLSILRRHLGRTDGARYVPSFKSAIHHFCIHAGGRAVLDGIEKNLRLTPEDMAHSRFCLREHGNTSSSSIWYELRHIEQHSELRRGHKILQLAFGSGFKCNSAVWTRIR